MYSSDEVVSSLAVPLFSLTEIVGTNSLNAIQKTRSFCKVV